jgi:hypothetical protein
MWKLLTLLVLLPQIAHADFVANAGLEFGTLSSHDTISSGKEVLKAPVLGGFKGEIEFGHPWITVFGAFHVNTGQAKAQFDYTNPDNPSDTATVKDLKTTALMSRASGGLRLRLIKLKKFRLFVGGGIEYGILNLTYDKDDFKKKNGNTTGFEESERTNLHGAFAEAGMEIIIDQDSGIRLVAQKSSITANQMKTLKDNKLKMDFISGSVNYIQYIDTGSW